MGKPIAEFKAHYNQNKKCIFIDGEGEAELKLTTDATQLAEVLRSMIALKGKLMIVRIYEDPEGQQGGKTLKEKYDFTKQS